MAILDQLILLYLICLREAREDPKPRDIAYILGGLSSSRCPTWTSNTRRNTLGRRPSPRRPVFRLHAGERTRYESCFNDVDPAAFALALQAGRTLTLDEAVEFALDEKGIPDPESSPWRGRARPVCLREDRGQGESHSRRQEQEEHEEEREAQTLTSYPFWGEAGAPRRNHSEGDDPRPSSA